MPALWAHGPVTVADNRRDESVAGMAARLLADAPQRFALVGLSMGGYVALEVMRQAPQRVIALVLISTSARPDTPEQVAGRRRQAEAAGRGEFDSLVEAAFPGLVDPGHRDRADLAAFWRRMAAEVGPEAFASQVRAAIDRPDSRPTLASITCPTAVIHGAGDQWIPLAHAEELAAGIPGAQLTVIAHAGHMLVEEQPEQARAAIEGLLLRAHG